MTVINLTQRFLEEKQGNFLQRRGLRKSLDILYVSSLAEMEDHFSQNPPIKEYHPGIKAVHVLMYNLQVKRHWPDSFDEQDGVSLEIGLKEGHAVPLFDLRDVTAQRIAQWQAGTIEDFFVAENKFHFNRDTFVSIPKIWLLYHCTGYQGVLDIVVMQEKNAQKPEKDSLFDKVLRWLPHLPPEEPQPAFA